MKQNNKIKFGLDNRYNTSWNALTVLAAAAFITGTVFYTLGQEQEIIIINTVEAKVQPREVQLITNVEADKIRAKEQFRQDHLAKLRQCESFGDDGIIGDNGDSVGPYQWQKATLEDKLGYKVTNKEWLLMATDYEFIHELTYKTYFEDEEWYRWYNCSVRLGYPN